MTIEAFPKYQFSHIQIRFYINILLYHRPFSFHVMHFVVSMNLIIVYIFMNILI